MTTLSEQFASGALERGNLMAEKCPSREIMKHVTSQWGLLIMIVLEQNDKLRFSEIRRKIGGVSERMLSQSLQVLERDGFIHRKALKVVPPHVEYSLTQLGVEMASYVRALADFIETQCPIIEKIWQNQENQ